MSNKLVIIGVGGTGAILVEHIKQILDNIEGKDFVPDLQYLVIDTSESNKKHALDNDVHFHHISKKSIDGEELCGAGGLRREIASDVKEGVISFINSSTIIRDDPKRTFYVILGSLGGGSGSTIGPIVTNLLIQEDRNVLVVVSGDDCSLLNASNTVRTLKLYNTIATRQNRALTMYYINENSNNKEKIDTDADIDNIEATNILMANAVVNYSLFLSGNNMQLDESEMSVFLNPCRLESELGEFPKGIYTFDYFIGETDFGDDSNIASARILSNSKDKIPTLKANNPRYGIPYSEELQKKMNDEGMAPIVILNRTGVITSIVDDLNATISTLENPMVGNDIGEIDQEDDFL